MAEPIVYYCAHKKEKRKSWTLTRDGIFKLLRSPGIDPKETIPPAYAAWRAGTTTLFLLGF
jgi:hypothetical protein